MRRFATVLLSALALSLLPVSAHAKDRGFEISVNSMPDGSQVVIRWDPCSDAITYAVNTTALRGKDKKSAVREVKAKVGELAKVSGLRFAYQGTTSFVPRSGNSEQQPAELVVAYVRPSQTDHPLEGWTAGFGGYSTSWNTAVDGRVSLGIVSGYVVVDVPQTQKWSKSLIKGGTTRPGLLAHELGHAVGLGHVNDPRQLMYPTLGPKAPRTFAAGDRAGLKKVGRPAGCLPFADLY